MGRARVGAGRIAPLAAVLVGLLAPAALADGPLPPPAHYVCHPYGDRAHPIYDLDGGPSAPLLTLRAPSSPTATLLVPVEPPPPPSTGAAPPPPPPPTSPAPFARPSDPLHAAAPRAIAGLADPIPVRTPSTIRLSSTLTGFLPADLDGGRGTFSLLRGLVEVEGTIPASPNLTWKWGAQAEADVYDFSEDDRIVAGTGRLLEEGYVFRAGPGLEWKVNDVWSVSGGVFGQSALVSGAAFGDTLSFGGTATVRFRVMQRLGVRAGALVRTNLGGSAFVIPIFGIDGGDEKGLGGPVRFSVRGSGCRVGYAFSPTLGVGLSARYDRRDWRLAVDDRVPEGIVRDIRIPIGVDLEWTIRKGLSLALEVGADVYHEVHVEDRDGNRLAIFEADPAPYVSLSATWWL